MSNQGLNTYNVALDLFMCLNSCRLCFVLGEDFKPEWYYGARDSEFILFELDPGAAQDIWKRINHFVDNLETDFVGFKANVNPICLAANSCNDCYRDQSDCSKGIDSIMKVADAKCFDVNFILNDKWYKNALQTVSDFLGLK